MLVNKCVKNHTMIHPRVVVGQMRPGSEKAESRLEGRLLNLCGWESGSQFGMPNPCFLFGGIKGLCMFICCICMYT